MGLLKTNLEGKIDAVNTAITNQLSTTEIRHITANALFDEMQDMCNTAQVYFNDRNALKASLYIIYDTEGNTQQRNGIVAANEVANRNLDAIAPDSKFKLQVRNGNELDFYFSQTEGGIAGTKMVKVAVNANKYIEASAADLGFNSSTGFIHFCIKNSGSAESVYRVVVD